MEKILISIIIFALTLSACTATPHATTTVSDSPAPDSPQPASTYLPAESPPRGAAIEFTTDFSKHSVPYSEILSGGPPKDGIPSINAPKFQSTNNADEWREWKVNWFVVFYYGKHRSVYPNYFIQLYIESSSNLYTFLLHSIRVSGQPIPRHTQ